MINKYLKTVRKVVSMVFLVLISLVFLDLYGLLSKKLLSSILYFQFIPSLIKFSVAGGACAAGFIAVLVFAVFAGRVYCSFLCPLGASIDIISRFFGRKHRKKKGYAPPHNGLRYTVLIFTLASIVLGTMGIVNLLDPYSNYGRVMGVLVKPVFVAFNNLLSHVLEYLDIYTVKPFIAPLAPFSVIISVCVFIIVVILMTVKEGRLYCNTLCPVGALLGLVSKGACFKLGIDPVTCTGCRKCELLCKAACVDSRNYQIDFTRCVSCYNCLDNCPEKSILFMRKWKNPIPRVHEHPDPHRRTLIVTLAFILTGLSKAAHGITKPVVYVKNKIPVIRKHPVTPPGSKSIDHFTARCTACHLCVTACPGKVIQPGLGGFGSKGLLMPRMVNRKGFCNFNCTICGEVCPTGAILPLEVESKKRVQVGRVVFIKENCIVITQKTECGACSEHCPTKAVYMVAQDKLRVPAVNPDICVGCGACEYACPAVPNKSIYVEGNPVHLVADKPKVEKLTPPAPDSDFPF